MQKNEKIIWEFKSLLKTAKGKLNITVQFISNNLWYLVGMQSKGTKTDAEVSYLNCKIKRKSVFKVIIRTEEKIKAVLT